MEKVIITKDDETWLVENYPGLHFDRNKLVISGKLCFSMYYSDKGIGYVINPDSSFENKDGVIIQDVYEIKIDLSSDEFLPIVREIGGRILKSKEKWGIDKLEDLHIYPDGTLCLCVTTEEETRMPNGFNLKDFFENLLIPFFYYQSFFERYGKEPWKGYSHGDLGILESYLRQKNPSPELITLFFDSLSDRFQRCLVNHIRFKGHELCICQSNRKFKKCHKDALLGYNKLKVDFLRQVQEKSFHERRRS
jgi:hypothetical protein